MSDQIPIDEQQIIPANDQDQLQQQQEVSHEEAMKLKSEELEREAARLRELNSQLNSETNNTHEFTPPTDEEKRDIDSRSIYIGNVDYGSTPLELQQHFSNAGTVQRVTILMNKFTGQPKGFAYLEFADVDGVNKAVATLDGSTFRDRQLKVSAKRTNIPGISIKRGVIRGRGRGGFNSRGGRGGRGGRGNFRGRGGGGRFTPY
ncbi:unnamed protein product [Candida verbasci]|uniref:RRM domain-containing protein n=1 Tax=Candida verbasci TaxID=1227364 RepID=A0A9W4XCC3_9ASCO|nr:unnamed protein product [Candida verbasci]